MWAAGQVDGDGTIGIYARVPRLSMGKAAKGLTSLQRLQQMFGGTLVSVGTRPSSVQEQFHWVLKGPAAQEVIFRLQQFVRLKRPQAKLVAQLVTGRYPVTVTQNGDTTRVHSASELAAVIGCSPGNISRLFRKHGECFEYAGHTVTRHVVANQSLEARVRQQQRRQHDVVGSSLHPAYVAGFVDADGYLGLQGMALKVQVAQKHPEILLALGSQYGGSVKRRRDQTHCWSVYGRSARAFLCVIKPFLYEKAKQAEILLAATPESCHEGEMMLKTLRGGKV